MVAIKKERTEPEEEREEYEQEVHLNIPCVVPKSSSCFELYGSTRSLIAGGTVPTSLEDENNSLRMKLAKSSMENRILERRNALLGWEVENDKKVGARLLRENQKRLYAIYDQYTIEKNKWIEELDQTYEKANAKISSLEDEIDYFKNLELSGDLSFQHKTGYLDDHDEFEKLITDSEYRDFRRRIFDFNPEEIDKEAIMDKLETLCEMLFASSQRTKKSEVESAKCTEAFKVQNTEFIDNKALLEQSQLELDDKLEYIEMMDKHWSENSGKLEAFDNLQAPKTLIMVKDIFKEFSKSMQVVKEISGLVSMSERRKPFDTGLMIKGQLFSDIDENLHGILDVTFLKKKISELTDVKRGLDILKMELTNKYDFTWSSPPKN